MIHFKIYVFLDTCMMSIFSCQLLVLSNARFIFYGVINLLFLFSKQIVAVLLIILCECVFVCVFPLIQTPTQLTQCRYMYIYLDFCLVTVFILFYSN